jgi:NAD(P)H-quinone oxidoreductase subunit 5
MSFTIDVAFNGNFMSRLIGVDRDWAEARAAAQFALKYFVAGSYFFLSVGFTIGVSSE